MSFAAGSLVLLVATIGRPVITWDEGYSIRREARMREWFRLLAAPRQPGIRGRLFDESVVHEFWQFAREEPDGHPPFYAVIGNVGWLAGQSWLPLIEAHRLGPIALFSVTLGVLYLFLARRWGRLAAATAAGSWLLMPRVFAHAHLASYDMPLACLWLLAVVAFWKSLEGWERSFARGLVWSVAFAVVLALAAATKFTGWLIPLPLLLWSAASGLGAMRREGWNALTRLLPVAALCVLWLITLPEVIRLIREANRATLALTGRPEYRDERQRFSRAAAIVRSSESGWLPLAGTLVPPAAWIVAAIVAGRRARRANVLGSGPVLRCWATALALTPTLTILLVPNWWHDPLRGIAIFLWSNLTRQHTTFIPTQFFGTLYEFSLPWYNTLAWVALTVPPGILMLTLLGACATVFSRAKSRCDQKGGETRDEGPRSEDVGQDQKEKEKRETGAERRATRERIDNATGSGASFVFRPPSLDFSFAWLVWLNAATLLVIRALPGAPGHDGERQLLGSFPFLACLAGLGAEWLRSQLGRRVTATAASWLVRGFVGLSLAWGAADIWHYRAAPLSYYTELVGGLNGATRRGLEPTYYWDSLDDDVLDWLAQHTGSGERVLFCNYAEDSFHYLEQSGKLRVNIWPDKPGVWRWYVLQNRPGLFAESPWNRWLAEHGERAVYTHELDGVPLIWIFAYEDHEKAIEATR